MRFRTIISSLALLILAGGIAAPTLFQSHAQDSGAGESLETAVTRFLLPESGPFNPADIKIDNDKAITDWYRSAHADQAAEAFRHWDGDEEIQPVCAVCHSGEGFRSFLGLDGSTPGVHERPIQPGGVVDCGTCHNEGLARIKEVLFPSGLLHPVEGVEAACMTCHQGRTSGQTVVAAIEGQDLDTANPKLRFINPHYATAAASWLGGYGGAGYHYEGRSYSGRFFHARPVSTCNSCHEPHTLEVAFEPCLTCHQGDEPGAIRSSRQSYDGSGNTGVGIRTDIANNAALLKDLILGYARDVAKAPLIYDGGRYPYFFADANGDGLVDQAEGRPVAYAAWTPRLLRAAYNWKLVTSDKGNFAHNPDYTLELLYDSIEDIGAAQGKNVDQLGILR
jgi:hypothetical protein